MMQRIHSVESAQEKNAPLPGLLPLLHRIPPNARERNQWVIKQALDTGVYGLVLPHLSTVEDAQAAVAAARYPQVPGVQDFVPAGERRLGQSHRLQILGPDPAGILRRCRPLAPGR